MFECWSGRYHLWGVAVEAVEFLSGGRIIGVDRRGGVEDIGPPTEHTVGLLQYAVSPANADGRAGLANRQGSQHGSDDRHGESASVGVAARVGDRANDDVGRVGQERGARGRAGGHGWDAARTGGNRSRPGDDHIVATGISELIPTVNPMWPQSATKLKQFEQSSNC